MDLRRPHPGLGLPSLPLWQRAWLDAYPPDVPSSIEYPSIPLSGLLENAAQRFPERIVCTLYDRGFTYKEMSDQGRRLARSLAELGAGPNKRVGMLMANMPDYLVALQATWLTGATALQLSPLMVAEEIKKWLETTDTRIVVALDLLAPMLMESLAPHGPLEHIVMTSLAPKLAAWKGWLYRVERMRRHGPLRLIDNHRVHLFDHLVRAKPRTGMFIPKVNPEEDVAILAPTGGTTASPKAVMLTHRNLIANAYQINAWSRMHDQPINVLGVLPFFHAYGLSVCLTSSMVGGWTVHMLPRFDPTRMLDLMQQHRIEMVPAVPAMLAAINRKLREKPRDLTCVRAVVSGAAPLDPGIRLEFSSYGPEGIVEGYGLSEASPVTHTNPIDPHGARIGTIGLPLPDTEARIMDAVAGHEELPNGAVGELVIRGPQVMKGYYNNPAETSRTLRGGWLYTGDLATRDRDGYFRIVDRKKDIIKTSGFLVFPAEVEEVLMRYPGVGEAAVIGVPDRDVGEIVKAMVVSKNGPIDVSSLHQHCAAHLSKHKRPRHIEMLTELPKNFLGKIQRRKLRENGEAPGERSPVNGNGKA